MPLPRDSDNRFAAVSPNDHSAWLWVASLLSLCYALCFLGFRIIVKCRRYGADDSALVLAYLFGLGHWLCMIVSLARQLGKSSLITTEERRRHASQALFAGRILLVPTLALSKVSVIFLTRQIFTVDMRKAWVACNSFIAVVTVWALLSIVTLSVRCSSAAALATAEDERCSGESVRWYLVLITDASTEIAFFALVCWLIHPLNMKFRFKALVVVAFSARIPAAAASIIFLFSTIRFLHTDADQQALEIVVPLIWQEALVGYSLISATIPCLRPLLNSFQTGGLVYLTGLGKMTADLRLIPGRSAKHVTAIKNDPSPDAMKLCPDNVGSNSHIYYSESPPQSESRATECSDSSIRRNVQWDVLLAE